MEKFFSDLSGDNKLLNFIFLGRPWNGLILGLVSLLFYLIFNQFTTFSLLLIIPPFLIYLAGSILNDIYDFDVDSINMSFSSLQRGIIKIEEAFLLSILLYLISLFISFFFGLEYFILSFILCLLSITYSAPPFYLVRKHLFGLINLVIVTITIPALMGVVYALKSFNLPIEIVYLIIYLSLMLFGIIGLKDLKDIKGDNEKGKKSLILLIGKNNFKLFNLIIFNLFFILSNIQIISLVKTDFLFYFGIILSFLIINFLILVKLNNRFRYSYLRLVLLFYFLLLIYSFTFQN